jgi:hypothetical protein
MINLYFNRTFPSMGVLNFHLDHQYPTYRYQTFGLFELTSD